MNASAREASELIPTRQSLLSRLKDWNDEDSWKAFFDTYWKLIYHAAIRAGLTQSEAQDVVQETIMAVAKQIPGFVYDPTKGSFKTWLMRQTNWRILGQLRKRMKVEISRPEVSTSTDTSTIDRVPDPAEPALNVLWDEEWETNLLEAAMRRLKAKVDGKHYQIFDLCVRQKWPVSKVAHDLKISAARVYLVKHRIGSLLRKEIAYLKTKLI